MKTSAPFATLTVLALASGSLAVACSPIPKTPGASPYLTSGSAPAPVHGLRIESAERPGLCITSRGGTGPTAIVGLATCDEGNIKLQRITYDGHAMRIGESCIARGGEFTGEGQGGRMQLWQCTGPLDPNPMTRIEPLDLTMDGEHLRVAGTQRCVVTQDVSAVDMPRLVLQPCADVAAQKWHTTKK